MNHPRYLSFEERKQIEKHLKKGFSYARIAELIGRSKTGVTLEARKGGGRNYSAKVAQEVTEKINKQKYFQISEKLKGNVWGHNKMMQRIENLEMQIEILYNAIKELVKDDKED